jgi:hypothetical protein
LGIVEYIRFQGTPPRLGAIAPINSTAMAINTRAERLMMLLLVELIQAWAMAALRAIGAKARAL